MENKTNVLVVENEHLLRNKITQILETHHCNVSTASNAIDGLVKAKKNKPDVIVSDMAMPELNGFQFLKRIRRYPETRCTPVVILLDSLTQYDTQNILNFSAVSYVSKKVFENELLAIINENLNKANAKYKKTHNSNQSQLTDLIKINQNIRPILTHSIIKTIVLKEAENANRLKDISFSLDYDSFKMTQRLFYFKKMIKHMIKHVLRLSDAGNKIIVFSHKENDNLRVGIKNVNVKNFPKNNNFTNVENGQFALLGESLDLSMIKSLVRIFESEMKIEYRKNNNFIISVLLKILE